MEQYINLNLTKKEAKVLISRASESVLTDVGRQREMVENEPLNNPYTYPKTKGKLLFVKRLVTKVNHASEVGSFSLATKSLMDAHESLDMANKLYSKERKELK